MSDPSGTTPHGQWRPGDPPPTVSPYAPDHIRYPAATNPAGRAALALGIAALVAWLLLEVLNRYLFGPGGYNRLYFEVLRVGTWLPMLLSLGALGFGISGLRRNGPRGAAGVGVGIGLTVLTLWVFTRAIQWVVFTLW